MSLAGDQDDLSPAKENNKDKKKLKTEDIPGAKLDLSNLSNLHNKENETPLRPLSESNRRTNGYQCCYFNCSSQFYMNGQRSTFHFFKVPLTSPYKNIWCNRMGKRDGMDGFVVTKNTKVCHLHFRPEDIIKVPGGSRWRLKSSALPVKVGKLKSPAKRKPPPERRTIGKVPARKQLEFQRDILIFQPKSLLATAILAAKNYQSLILDENKRLKKQLEDTENKLENTKKKLQQQTFNINILHNNQQCQHYTGFPDYKRLQIFLEFLDVGEDGRNVRMRESSEGMGGRPRLLKPEEQLLMTLVKLRQGFTNMHCAWLFNCSESTASRIICSWLNFLYLKLCTLPIWPTRQEINQAMPETFKKSFPNTRAIIDCTEIFVESPESLHLRSTFYSDYKHHNTYKALIAITPAGSLSFVSELYPGSVSDREITRRCGILNPKFWEEGDELMADKGFTIRDLLDPLGVKLNIPIFLENNMQFTAKQVCANQKIAAQRIHVERYINRIKNFGIFNRPIPISMHGTINQIFTVCSLLVMFQNPIISVK